MAAGKDDLTPRAIPGLGGPALTRTRIRTRANTIPYDITANAAG